MAVQRTAWTPTVSRFLCGLGVLCFVLAAFGVHFPVVDIVDLGLALFSASFLGF
jgi:hypothetical protein